MRDIGRDNLEWLAEAQRASEFLSLIDQDNRLLYVNHPQPGIGNYAGRSVFEFVAPEYHAAARTAIEQARETGLPRHYESMATGPNGQQSFYSNWIFHLPGTSASGVTAFVATDITEQRRMAAALEQADVTMRSLVDNAPDQILIVDRERRVLFINRLELGLRPEEVLSRPAETLVLPGDRKRVADQIERVIVSGQRSSFEATLQGPDARRYYSVRLGPILLDGRVNRVIMIVTDMTERRQAEREKAQLAAQLQQAQKMEALGQLTGGVAHDFNNLLTAIGGNIELAGSDPDLSPQASEFLREAVKAVQRAAELTQRLLAFSRKQQLQPTVENVNTLVSGMRSLLQRTLGEAVEIVMSQQAGLWPCEVDRSLLEHAVVNLAVNARDAMPGGGCLSIETANVELPMDLGAAQPPLSPGAYVRMMVSDDGVGMSEEVMRQAMEPFYTTKEVGEGSGLGLSMVYGFVAQSGGHVELRSELGRGTTVDILLPRARRDEEVARPAAAEPPPQWGAGQLVLVVEDESQLRDLSCRMLERLGYRTLSAGNAREALARLEHSPAVGLLFTDVVIPGRVNGLELAKQARAKRPDLRVLFTTGYAEGVAGTALPAHTDMQLLRKPFGIQELATSMQRTFDEPPRQVG
ncbi:MAG: PAS domain-containing protein [Myxococcales bacterium]|nr:PAS domain-containing protein [Myxococcales bacterium]